MGLTRPVLGFGLGFGPGEVYIYIIPFPFEYTRIQRYPAVWYAAERENEQSSADVIHGST